MCCPLRCFCRAASVEMLRSSALDIRLLLTRAILYKGQDRRRCQRQSSYNRRSKQRGFQSWTSGVRMQRNLGSRMQKYTRRSQNSPYEPQISCVCQPNSQIVQTVLRTKPHNQLVGFAQSHCHCPNISGPPKSLALSLRGRLCYAHVRNPGSPMGLDTFRISPTGKVVVCQAPRVNKSLDTVANTVTAR